MKILVINGANMNMLGRREPDIYGKEDYAALCARIYEHAQNRGLAVECFQSNHEGAIIDAIQDADTTFDGIVINPGAYTHYSYAIHDALKAVRIPAVEVHMSDIQKREEFRHLSVTAPACIAQIRGHGFESYTMAIDMLSKLETIETLVSVVEERSPQTVREYRERLEARLRDVLADRALDEQRVITEAAIFADRTAVDEETVRLRSHIAQFRAMLQEGSPIGRKMDFLVQEFNRESNTIGSKCSDAALAKVVVDLKSEIEKIREQLQNVE